MAAQKQNQKQKKERPVAAEAFYKSIPVMGGYLILGAGFGILLRSSGYGVLWAAAMSILIYAGSMQFVGVGLIAGGASVASAIFYEGNRIFNDSAFRRFIHRTVQSPGKSTFRDRRNCLFRTVIDSVWS